MTRELDKCDAVAEQEESPSDARSRRDFLRTGGLGLGGIAAASDNDGQWFDVKASDAVPIGAAVGAIVGTIIGLTIGLFPRRGDLIYRAGQE